MEIKTTGNYTINDSSNRISSILNSAESFEELSDIPSRDRLTYSNGFYVNCTAVFIDIRGSSTLTDIHTRPVLGKIYRSYISECVSLMHNNVDCREIFINGDCVSGIFHTPLQMDVNHAFSTAARLNSLINMLNWKLEQKGYIPIKCGIGISYGRALMMKAGYSGSGINDVVWLGDVVNEASNLCHQGNKEGRMPIQVSGIIYSNLTQHNKDLLRLVYNKNWYEGDVINKDMDEWLTLAKRR